MGFLRILLAIVVLWGHTLPTNCNKLSLVAVEVFFIISGFYMELIKNKYPSTIDFYKSRFIRICVLYYIVLITTIAVRLYFNDNPLGDNQLTNIVTIVQNIFIFGQDFLRGMFYLDGHFYFSEVEGATPLYNPILGQAWSISLELTFYLCVPFLLRLSSKILIAITLVSLWMRFQYLVGYRGITGNWNTLFPGELCFFLLGSLGYRLYNNEKYQNIFKYFEKFSLKQVYALIFILFVIGLSQPIQIFKLHGVRAYLSLPIEFTIIFAILIPFIFHLSKNNKFDQKMGNLSYGLYIWHMFIVENLIRLGLKPNSSPRYSMSAATLLIGLTLAILSYHFIEKKIDHYRHKSLLRQKNPKAA